MLNPSTLGPLAKHLRSSIPVGFWSRRNHTKELRVAAKSRCLKTSEVNFCAQKKPCANFFLLWYQWDFGILLGTAVFSANWLHQKFLRRHPAFAKLELTLVDSSKPCSLRHHILQKQYSFCAPFPKWHLQIWKEVSSGDSKNVGLY